MSLAGRESRVPEIVDQIVGFLRGIGLVVDEGAVPDDAFLPGIRIHAGTIVFDRGKLLWPGDLLHEAGHIAVTPASARARLSDGLEESEHAHAGEMEATAWAFAAIRSMGLDPAVLFHAGGYHGRSAGLITTYTAGVYPGCMGLSAAGMTLLAPAAAAKGATPYPDMIRWLRE